VRVEGGGNQLNQNLSRNLQFKHTHGQATI
jgi:hypothetical protein